MLTPQSKATSMKIESFEETFLDEIEGIRNSSFSFNRGAPQEFLYGRRYDFKDSKSDKSIDSNIVPHVLFLHDIGEHGSRYKDFFHSFLKQNNFDSFWVEVQV